MKKSILLALTLLLGQTFAFAGPGYYLVTVYEDEGEKSVDLRTWHVKPRDRASVSASEIGFSYNVTKRWFTELYLTWLRVDGAGTQLNDIAWQNDYLLTQGQLPFDLAMHTELKRYEDGSRGYGVEFGPALQTEFGRTQVNANVFFERSYRTETANTMQMKYQWQVKQRWRPALEFGLRGFGELGDWDHWAPRREQSHRAGPVIGGMVPVGTSNEIKYEVGYFFGKVAAEQARTAVVRVQYEF
jgi:hypothetical protein